MYIFQFARKRMVCEHRLLNYHNHYSQVPNSFFSYSVWTSWLIQMEGKRRGPGFVCTIKARSLRRLWFDLSSCLRRVSLALTKILGSEYLEENLFSVDFFLKECDVLDCTLWKKTLIFFKKVLCLFSSVRLLAWNCIKSTQF